MLNNLETGYSALTELASRDLKTARGIVNTIKDTYNRIKDKLTHNEGRYYGKYVKLAKYEEAIKLFEKAVRDGARNKGSVINSNQNSNGVSFSFEGVTKGGIRIYKTDFPIGTSKKTKQTLFENRVATIFNLGAVTLNTSTKKIEIKGDMFTAEKNLYGDKKASKKEMKAKLNSLYDLADILATSNFKKVKSEDSYINPNIKPKNKAHKGVKYWYKFENRIYLDGDLYDVTFNIRDKGKEQYEYLIEFKDLKKKMTPVGNTVQKRPPANYRASSSKGMVSQNKPIVKGKNSGNPTNNTQNDFTDYSKYRNGDNGNTAVLDKPADNKNGAVDNNTAETATKKGNNGVEVIGFDRADGNYARFVDVIKENAPRLNDVKPVFDEDNIDMDDSHIASAPALGDVEILLNISDPEILSAVKRVISKGNICKAEKVSNGNIYTVIGKGKLKGQNSVLGVVIEENSSGKMSVKGVVKTGFGSDGFVGEVVKNGSSTENVGSEKSPAKFTEDDLLEAYDRKETLQKDYEKAKRKIRLTDEEKYQLDGLLSGKVRKENKKDLRLSV